MGIKIETGSGLFLRRAEMIDTGKGREKRNTGSEVGILYRRCLYTSQLTGEGDKRSL
jgi:hypothetical protein